MGSYKSTSYSFSTEQHFISFMFLMYYCSGASGRSGRYSKIRLGEGQISYIWGGGGGAIIITPKIADFWGAELNSIVDNTAVDL